MDVFDLSEAQADYILELQLRRLTKFSRHRAGDRARPSCERPDRGARGDPRRREAAAQDGVRPSWPTSPRRTARRAARCCWSRPAPPPRPPPRSRSPTTRAGCCCRRPGCWPAPPRPTRCPSRGRPQPSTTPSSAPCRTTARGEVGLVTSRGRMVRLSALELPDAAAAPNGAPSLSGGAPARGLRRPAAPARSR